MRVEQDKTRCAILPSFRDLVNYAATERLLIQLRQPRDLNNFLTRLLNEISMTANVHKFRATLDQVTKVLKDLQTSIIQSENEHVHRLSSNLKDL